jgi:hypothetical protein
MREQTLWQDNMAGAVSDIIQAVRGMRYQVE